MPAFQHAVDLGYTYLETDVHATNDGVLVAFHDPDLSRTTDRTGTISSLPWRELQHARVAGREPIPMFEELVGSFPNHRFNIDCKANSRARRPDRVVEAARLPRPGVPRQLQRHLASAGCAPCSATACARASGPPRSRRCAPVAPSGGVARSHRSHRASAASPSSLRRMLATAHAQGHQVHVWTIDDRAEMGRLLDLGVDGIMTDRPQVLKDAARRARSMALSAAGVARPTSMIVAPTSVTHGPGPTSNSADLRRVRARQVPSRPGRATPRPSPCGAASATTGGAPSGRSP